MLTLLKNTKARMIISLMAGFSFGQLIFGGLREMISPIGVLLVVLVAMPVLAWGFYLNFSALVSHLESANEPE